MGIDVVAFAAVVVLLRFVVVAVADVALVMVVDALDGVVELYTGEVNGVSIVAADEGKSGGEAAVAAAGPGSDDGGKAEEGRLSCLGTIIDPLLLQSVNLKLLILQILVIVQCMYLQYL